MRYMTDCENLQEHLNLIDHKNDTYCFIITEKMQSH